MAKRIYITNLPKTVTRRDLSQAFSRYGTVDDVHLAVGSATITMSVGAETAIKSLHQTDMGGRRISVVLKDR